ncbi:MAG: glycosyltransferase [Clostridia bacterium]|nr:glycosyltransferase [Clostridia bacterium]
MEFNYNLYPGKERKVIEFEKHNIEPKITIVTAYYNGHKYIDETINSVLNQTYPHWEWLIVNDGSTDEESIKKLKDIENIDNRISIINKENGGLAETRDYGANRASKSSKYLFFLDDDDLIDKTYLECAYITLETNRDAAWAYTDLVNFSGQEFLWAKYFDSEIEKKENLLVATALIRKKDFFEVNGYELREKAVNEDWNLWLKLLAKGKFPVRMDFVGFWYRKKPKEESELERSKENYKRAQKIINETASTITKKVKAIQYPKQDYNWDILEDIKIEIPFRKKDNKIHILLVLPWLSMGGADKFNLDFIKGLSKRNYEFTVITTEPSMNIWRQQFEEFATVYDLTTFLDRKYWASFINYIIKKENINIVMNSNSTFGYAALPYIKASNPQVPIMDYIHMEEWYNRNGGFSRDSSNLGDILEKTLVCNNNSKNILINHFGRKEESIETVYIGVDCKKFNPEKFNKNDILNKYNINSKNKIIGYIARIDLQKRPYLLMKIIKALKAKRNDFLVLIAGDGPLLSDIKKITKKYNIEQNVKFLGPISNTAEVYAMCDITLNCSIKEGVALTSYESLSMGVPVVSANVGGQAELINDKVGVIVPCLQKEEDILNYNYSEYEINNYVDAINKVLNNIDFYKNNSKKAILEKFSIEKMVIKMDEIFKDISKREIKVSMENYKDISKELITKYLMLHSQEYEWLCKQLNLALFGEEKVEIAEKTQEQNKSNFKVKVIRLTVKLHIYKECKIIFKIFKQIWQSIKNTIKLILELFKQISKRFFNLFKIGRKK